ncbi:MAG: YccF domain-containing protein [Proteobacteria bacterium]|nr:YccF domain-containing protein [Pseudomonadota bacterium]
MGGIRFLGNVLWFLLGGIVAGLCWYLAGIVAAITIVGLPWARACFRIGTYTFFPFGREVVWNSELSGKPQGAMGVLRLIGNVIWFIPIGFSLMVIHVLAAAACFITVIGIPFGWAHLKLAAASVFPLGQRVVPISVARLAREQNAGAQLAAYRHR